MKDCEAEEAERVCFREEYGSARFRFWECLFYEHFVFSWWLLRAEDSAYSTVVRFRNYHAVGDEKDLGGDGLSYA